MHQARVLHRDISPDNIYINDAGRAKILDFGAAKQDMSSNVTSVFRIVKHCYSPIEQYSGGADQGPWTDVYAMAATLYSAIVGDPPPNATDRQRHDSIVPPSRLGVEMPAAAELALMKALAVQPQDRFQTMAEFRQALSGPVGDGLDGGRRTRRRFTPDVSRDMSDRVTVQDSPRPAGEKGDRMASQRSSPRELSAFGYAVVAFILLIIAIVLWFYFISVFPTLPPSAQQTVYWPIRILLSLVAGVILFGAMKSGAQLHQRIRGNDVRLAGPVAGVLVFLLLGYKAPPPEEPVYDLTVWALGRDKMRLSDGRILMQYTNTRRPESFVNGEANFKAIPRDLRGTQVTFWPEVKGYSKHAMRVTLPTNESAITLTLEPEQSPTPAPEDPKPKPSPGPAPDKKGKTGHSPKAESDTNLRIRAFELNCRDAVPLLTQLSNREPEDSEVFYRLGACEGQIGQREDAREHLDQAEKLGGRPFVPRVAVELGKIALAANEPIEATRQMNRALQAEPGFPPAMFLRGEILLKEGKHPAAIEAFYELFNRFDTSSDQQRTFKLDACKKLAEALERNQAFDTAKQQRARCELLR